MFLASKSKWIKWTLLVIDGHRHGKFHGSCPFPSMNPLQIQWHLGFQLQDGQDHEHEAQPQLLQEDPNGCTDAPGNPGTMRNRRVMGRELAKKNGKKPRENRIVGSKPNFDVQKNRIKLGHPENPERDNQTIGDPGDSQATQATQATAKSPKVAVHEAIATAILFSQAIRVPGHVDFWANFSNQNTPHFKGSKWMIQEQRIWSRLG